VDDIIYSKKTNSFLQEFYTFTLRIRIPVMVLIIIYHILSDELSRYWLTSYVNRAVIEKNP